MNSNEKKSFSYYMRCLHRDIGFFTIGLVVIYSLSGIVLIYRDSSLFKVDKEVVKQLSVGLETSAISREAGNIGRGPSGGRPESGGTREEGAASRESGGEGRAPDGINREEGSGRGMRMRGLSVVKEEGDMVYFDKGTYNRATGEFKTIVSEVVFPINKMVELHKAGTRSTSHWFITAFAAILIFLAVSSFWMFRKGNPNFKRGLLFSGAGVLLSVILFFV